ncbi:hypothetical protein, partial [Candidatus Symbiopectobacterium sp. NZEC135]|uniref:hypothetical protein n=1 Tax=Candidatus Symbiopectobacterium sp. NZEC135 TaxID=2820471 RepID=UPI002228089E
MTIKTHAATVIILMRSVIAISRTDKNRHSKKEEITPHNSDMAKYSDELIGVARALYLKRATPKEIAAD